jgi:hypothetical protein
MEPGLILAFQFRDGSEVVGMDKAKRHTHFTAPRGDKIDSLFRQLTETKFPTREPDARHYLSAAEFWSLDSRKRRQLLKLG